MINNKKEGIILVSLGAYVMTPHYLSYVARHTQSMCDELIICLLDKPEITNQSHLCHLSIASAEAHVQKRCKDLSSALMASNLPNIKINSWTNYANLPNFIYYLETVNNVYTHSREFASHCHNQIFRNLQPLLRQHGISSKRHPMMVRLAPYIIEEIAMKLFIADQNIVDLEFGPAAEMDIIVAIYEGKYLELLPVAKQRLPYIIVDPKMENTSGLP